MNAETAALITGILMIFIGIRYLILEGTKDSDRIIGKYPLGEIKATLKATPDEPCKDFNDWQYEIFKLRNSK